MRTLFVGKISLLHRGIIGIILLLITIFGITACSFFKSSTNIKQKLERVNEDLLILRVALEEYLQWFAFYPLPDYVLDLPEDKFLEVCKYSHCAYLMSKQDVVNWEKQNYPVFIHEFRLFPEFYTMFKKPDLPKRFSAYWDLVRNHRIDVFDKNKKAYGYGRGIMGTFYILISSGPDGKRDIEISKFNDLLPNYGFEKPFYDFLYDPTNGIFSNGDIVISTSGLVRSGGILETYHPYEATEPSLYKTRLP